MNIEKIYEIQKQVEELNLEERMKLIREIFYSEYEKQTDWMIIHQYQLTRDMIDILTQMLLGRKFDEDYLKGKIKWWKNDNKYFIYNDRFKTKYVKWMVFRIDNYKDNPRCN